VKDLHRGAVRDVRDGHYNIKNPACYVFPRENNCEPGEHFRVDQKAEMENFIAYRPFHFEISTTQKIANLVTKTGLVVTAGVLLLAMLRYLMGVFSRGKRPAAAAE